jgi:hypothetical protein
MVTVASAFSSSNETGKPTMLLRPTTTALFPLNVTPLRVKSSRQPFIKETIQNNVKNLPKGKVPLILMIPVTSVLYVKNEK